MSEDARRRRWGVGRLARAGGVTVRALHYHEQIGLVTAGERTPNGHRRYTPEDVRRLFRVLALQQLGMSLDEVRAALAAGEGARLRDLLVAQLAVLDARAERIDELRGRIRALLSGDAAAEPERLLETLERSQPLVDTGAYLTDEQRAALGRRSAELGPAAVDALRLEWLELVKRLLEFVRADVPETDPRARELAKRWAEIGRALRGPTGDDARLAAATERLWRDNRDLIDEGIAARVGWLRPGDLATVTTYLERIREHD